MLPVDLVYNIAILLRQDARGPTKEQSRTAPPVPMQKWQKEYQRVDIKRPPPRDELERRLGRKEA